MKPFQERVIEEKRELDTKLEKLIEFFDGPIYGNLPEPERVRLLKQSKIMQEYSQILGERIASF